jgi:hypothetical protein
MPKTRTNHRRHPGGRPAKPNKELFVQVTCVLRRDTLKRLKTAAGRHFGGFLQAHLDRYPLPTKKEYSEQLAFEGAIAESVIEAATRKHDAPRKTAKS